MEKWKTNFYVIIMIFTVSSAFLGQIVYWYIISGGLTLIFFALDKKVKVLSEVPSDKRASILMQIFRKVIIGFRNMFICIFSGVCVVLTLQIVLFFLSYSDSLIVLQFMDLLNPIGKVLTNFFTLRNFLYAMLILFPITIIWWRLKIISRYIKILKFGKYFLLVLTTITAFTFCYFGTIPDRIKPKHEQLYAQLKDSQRKEDSCNREIEILRDYFKYIHSIPPLRTIFKNDWLQEVNDLSLKDRKKCIIFLIGYLPNQPTDKKNEIVKDEPFQKESDNISLEILFLKKKESERNIAIRSEICAATLEMCSSALKEVFLCFILPGTENEFIRESIKKVLESLPAVASENIKIKPKGLFTGWLWLQLNVNAPQSPKWDLYQNGDLDFWNKQEIVYNVIFDQNLDPHGNIKNTVILDNKNKEEILEDKTLFGRLLYEVRRTEILPENYSDFEQAFIYARYDLFPEDYKLKDFFEVKEKIECAKKNEQEKEIREMIRFFSTLGCILPQGLSKANLDKLLLDYQIIQNIQKTISENPHAKIENERIIKEMILDLRNKGFLEIK